MKMKKILTMIKILHIHLEIILLKERREIRRGLQKHLVVSLKRQNTYQESLKILVIVKKDLDIILRKTCMSFSLVLANPLQSLI